MANKNSGWLFIFNMNKREYIQMCTLLYRSKNPNDKGAIAYGLAMWDRLTEHGFGDTPNKSKTKPKTRKSYDWYAELEGTSKEYFDQFWSNWKDSRGKNEAASAWIKRGDMAKREMQHLVYAGGVYAFGRSQIKADGLNPIMAQGFINQRRDVDIPLIKDQESMALNQKNEEEIRTINGDLIHFKKLLEKTGEAHYSDEIERLRNKLKNMRAKT